MRDTSPVRVVMDRLCEYYADRDGNPRRLNTTQAAVYLAGLGGYAPQELERAATVWMGKSKFFPALSELLEILSPPIDWPAVTNSAWATVEQAIKHGGAYRGAWFAQGAVGEAVREVFGTWPTACSFDFDSPGWAIRRQTFLAVFPSIAQREHEPMVLRGLNANDAPYAVPLVHGLPEHGSDSMLPEHDPSPREAQSLIADIESRFLAKKVLP